MRYAAIWAGVLLVCGNALADTNELVFTEIMYNTAGSPDVEYVEIFNHTASTVDLTGWYFLDDNDTHAHCVLVGTLPPGQVLVIAGDPTLFANAYPAVTNVNPNYFTGWNLDNGGELVRLYNASSEIVDAVQYGDAAPWPTEPDGNGPSLELIDPSLDNSLGTSWVASVMGGTPGTYEPQSPVDEASWSALKARWR